MRALLLLSFFELRGAARAAVTEPSRYIPLLLLALLVIAQFTTAPIFDEATNIWGEVAGEFLQANHGEVRAAAFLVLALLAIGNLDYGFGTGFLTFTRSDIDWLFPAPVSPKVVLAFRLVAKSLLGVLQGAGIYFFFVWRPLTLAAPELGAAQLWTAWLAIGFCTAGYAALTLWGKLMLGVSGAAWLRRLLIVALAAGGAALAMRVGDRGLTGLVDLSREPAAALLLFPCSLAAEAAAAPLRGTTATETLWPLALFHLTALLLVFGRTYPVYEVALGVIEPPSPPRQAPAAARRATQRFPSWVTARPWSALFFSHLISMLRRPMLNVALPLAGGPLLLLLTRNWPPPRFPAIHSAALALYIITVSIVGGVHVFRLALARRPLLRPIPMSSLAVVMSDIAARSLPLLIFAGSLGLTLLAAGERRAPEVAVAMIIALPPVLILSHTLMYVLAAGYPSQEDRGHLLLGGILGFAGAGLLVSLLVFWSIAGLAFRLSPLLTAATLWPPALGGAWLLALAAARLYESDAPS